MLSLASCQWVRERQNCLITGPTGVGKTYLACALAHKACREGASTRYARVTRLLEELAIARADGSYTRRLAAVGRLDLLVLDDWGLAPLTDEGRRQELQAKGMPPLPAISALPGVRRWEAMNRQALLLLQSIQEEMQDYYDERSDTWKESERGESMAERLQALQDAIAAVEGLC